jgi:hypothetical protein
MSEDVSAAEICEQLGLTESELSLLCNLAILDVAKKFGVTKHQAAQMLAEGTRREMVHFAGEQQNVTVTFHTDSGSTIVTRADVLWLRSTVNYMGFQELRAWMANEERGPSTGRHEDF